MTQKKTRNNNIKAHRKIHRLVAIIFLVFFLVISASGILLGWKKHSAGVILPASREGSSEQVSDWLSFDSLTGIAIRVVQDSLSKKSSTEISRIDARPDKGMVKFVFDKHFTEVQLDASTGEVLYVGKRWSDIIEHIHDGSYVDRWFGIKKEYFKLIYTSLMGLSLITLSVTGFYLWKQTRRKKKNV